TLKILAAAKQYNIHDIGVAGGVAANSGLRKRMEEIAKEQGWNIYFPAMQYCTDNAGMIAMAAYYKYVKHDFSSLATTAFVRDGK
ncbi:MAG: tRNA (adenosine(37)-N6)-threonylcarbamoyltransferase complex transferase subunit TsaD, partial [Saprospiraceae bacterium]